MNSDKMEFKIELKYIWIFFGIILSILISYQLYVHFKPVKTIFIRKNAFSFRQDIKKALNVEIFPREDVLNQLFSNYRIKNVTILFKPGTPKTNTLYQLQTIEIVYKLSKYDHLTRKFFMPKKQFNAEPIDSYENITREDTRLKIILVPPEFSNKTRVSAGGNRIWIYGKTDKEFDYAVMKAILSVMNITSLEGHV